VKKAILALVFVSLAATGCHSKIQKTQKTFKVRCEKGSVDKLLDEGWKVVSTNEREVQCGSRNQAAGYIVIAKGSHVTKQSIGTEQIPIMGTEVEYILENSKKH
jgi:hypothetical protein